MSFSSFKLHPKLTASINALGYKIPTPIQVQAIPPILAGKDVMGLAQTGTGKTAVFALPILERLLSGPRGKVRALIIAPTRELAEQIHVSFCEMGRNTGLKSCTVYGGVSINPQIQKLRIGIDIVVACPGRLLDHLNQKTISLANLEVLVLDEADRMFDMGFLPDIRRILKQLPIRRQTLMFSATMPDSIRKLTDEALHDPVTVRVGHTAPANTVSHALYPVGDHLKTSLLMELLKQTDTESILIFTRTKHRAKRIGQELERAGYRAASLQGNLSQNKRQNALDGFRNGSYQILVATDIAARGIDVLSISHVINYDIPDTTDAYTHRIGRTGRAAKTGDAFTFISPEDEPLVKSIERVLGKKIERRTLKDFDYTKSAPLRKAGPAHPLRSSQPRKPQQKQAHIGVRTNAGAQPGVHNSQPKAHTSRPQTISAQPKTTHHAHSNTHDGQSRITKHQTVAQNHSPNKNIRVNSPGKAVGAVTPPANLKNLPAASSLALKVFRHAGLDKPAPE